MEQLKHILQDFLNRGLVISPWLAGVGRDGRFDDMVFEYVNEDAQSMADLDWTEEMVIQIFDTLPSPQRLPRTAIYEIAASTAVSMAHNETGFPDVNEEFAQMAMKKVKAFCADYDLAVLVQLYLVTTKYENDQAISFFGKMPEREFMLGRWHRPWVDYSLSDELIVGVLEGNYQIEIDNGKRFVSLSAKGVETFRSIERFLEETGYLAQRVRQLHITQFNLLDFGEMAKGLTPDWIPQRREFLDWAGIRTGMRVLEIGCADGLFTFDGGLAERVGSTGSLVAMDPSRGMLTRAKLKNAEYGYPWLTFQQGKAESIPFADGAFDAVIGVAFLHFTDIPIALREMARVARRGGIVASFHPLPFEMDSAFFKDWFAPLHQLAKLHNRDRPKDFLTPVEEMERYFSAIRLRSLKSYRLSSRLLFQDPKKLVAGMIRGVGWSQEELAMIPWKAREDVIRELEIRGERVCSEYEAEELVIRMPNQMLKGIVR